MPIPELTPDDIAFFRDEENWMYGPTYDLHLTVASSDLEGLREAISSVPGMLPWHPRGEHGRSILRSSNDAFGPVGLFHLYRVRASLATCDLVIYPPMMRHACGLGVWETPTNDQNVSALRELHAIFLGLARWVDARVPVLFASLYDETDCISEFEGARGYLWLDTKIAARIGWAGRTTDYWTGVPL
jgi:hypothetical protein